MAVRATLEAMPPPAVASPRPPLAGVRPTEKTTSALTERPIVERPRLTRLLDRATTRIILLCAPAGYGKTTLARQWLTHRKHVWYPCTAASSDVAGLAADLFKAIVEVHPHLERDLRLHLRVAAEAPDQLEHLTEVVVDHFATWPADTLLAIDDYQLIAQSPASEALFAALVQRTSVPLMITARQRPTWATARAFVYGDIAEISQESLAITRAESASFVVGKAPAVGRELTVLSNGWPAILALAWNADPRVLPRSTEPVPEMLFDFIAEEVYGAAPGVVRRNLPLLAQAQALTESLITSVLPPSEAAEFLAALCSMGIKSPRRTEVPLHPLLREFLARLPAIDAPAQLTERLVTYLLGAKQTDDAFAVSLRARKDFLIATTVQESLHNLLDSGRHSTLSRWLDSLDDSKIRIPEMRFARAALARRRAEYQFAETQAIHACREAGERHPLLAFGYIIAGSSAHLSHRDEQALEHFAKAEGTCQSDRDYEDMLWGRLVASSALESADATWIEAELHARANGASPTTQIRFSAAQYVTGRATGTFTRALATCEANAPLLDECTDPLIASMYLHATAYMQAFSGRYHDALEGVDRTLKYATQYRLSFVRPHALSTQCLALIGIGEYHAAADLADQITGLVRDKGARRFTEANTNIMLARIAMAHSDFRKALDLTDPTGVDLPERGLYAELQAMHALSLLGSGDEDGALRVLDAALSTSQGAEARCVAAGLRAVMAARRGITSCFSSELSEISQRGGGDIVVLCSRAFPEFVESAAVHPEGRALLAQLLTNSRDAALAQKHGIPFRKNASGSPATILTPREMEIAELLVAGLSNRAIASHLVISESTAKVHVKSIFKKLGTHNRSETVVKLLRRTL